MKTNKIGLRTIKTGLAIVATLLVCELFKIANPFFATIAAIFAMESSISATFTAARDRMYGTVLGAAVAIFFSTLFPVNPLSIGLGIIIVIYICNLFKWQGTIKISSIVFLAILLGFKPGEQFEYALFRTVDTFIGVSISTLINYFVFPYDVSVKIENTLNSLNAHLEKVIKQIDSDDVSEEIIGLEEDLIQIKTQFELLIKEVKVSKKTKHDVSYIQSIIEQYSLIMSHLKVLVKICGDVNTPPLDTTVHMHTSQLELISVYHKSEIHRLYEALVKT